MRWHYKEVNLIYNLSLIGWAYKRDEGLKSWDCDSVYLERQKKPIGGEEDEMGKKMTGLVIYVLPIEVLRRFPSLLLERASP